MQISQPRWKEPEYTQKQINKAGDIIRDPKKNNKEKEKALIIIDNWRAAHAYPLIIPVRRSRQSGEW